MNPQQIDPNNPNMMSGQNMMPGQNVAMPNQQMPMPNQQMAQQMNQQPQIVMPGQQPAMQNMTAANLGSAAITANQAVPVSPNKDTPTSTQSTLLISEMRDNVVIMKDGSFRAVIACKSINFDLMSDMEREGVEYS